ncbi:hypothetical protein [Streptomyces sp. SBT349]|uniref:hypothetical protein n=1 Tax=Streptomyces sp. SBT349 TaxID=1580539 RepID=UPI00066C2B1D|nr:hypothetical protein [Streptomyces sp. SBT349]
MSEPLSPERLAEVERLRAALSDACDQVAQLDDEVAKQYARVAELEASPDATEVERLKRAAEQGARDLRHLRSVRATLHAERKEARELGCRVAELEREQAQAAELAESQLRRIEGLTAELAGARRSCTEQQAVMADARPARRDSRDAAELVLLRGLLGQVRTIARHGTVADLAEAIAEHDADVAARPARREVRRG